MTEKECVCVCVCVKVCVCVCVCVLARRAASSGGRGLWFVVNDLYAPPTRCWLAGSVALHPLLGLSRLHHPWEHTASQNNMLLSLNLNDASVVQLQAVEPSSSDAQFRSVVRSGAGLTFTEIQEELLDAFI